MWGLAVYSEVLRAYSCPILGGYLWLCSEDHLWYEDLTRGDRPLTQYYLSGHYVLRKKKTTFGKEIILRLFLNQI